VLEAKRLKPGLLSFICCPDCHGPFSLSSDVADGAEIISGTLACPQCKTEYAVIDGLPVILLDTKKMRRTQASFGTQWTWQSTGYFEDDTIYGQSQSEELLDFKSIFQIPELGSLSGKMILDAGCGSGRLTSSLAREAKHSTIIGFDISDAARVAFDRCREHKNVHILKCDLLQPPFRPRAFDYIWSEGVIHHTPDSEQSFDSLSNLLSEGGMFYIWVYPDYRFSPYRLVRDILWKSYLMPPRALYLLSWLLALPLFACLEILRLGRIVKTRRTLTTLVFQFFDNLSPEFQHRHSKDEVEGWFRSRHFGQIRFVADIGAVGLKAGTSPQE